MLKADGDKVATAVVLDSHSFEIIREVAGIRRAQGVVDNGRAISISGVFRSIISDALPKLEQELEESGFRRRTA
ncbi:hypothetical protein [Gluconobacter cerinus]|uniref:hypothetical protein n=1 Tax=Gluconobacter cerinus TaxID=38307 RepID=UPI001B8D4225|nr:hypothetical protein [Gluconobacter cerinus]MBS1038115.1 hypothetical protein [Gluconobacter cerinus]